MGAVLRAGRAQVYHSEPPAQVWAHVLEADEERRASALQGVLVNQVNTAKAQGNSSSSTPYSENKLTRETVLAGIVGDRQDLGK